MNKNWRCLPLSQLAKISGGKRLPKGKNLQKEKNTHPYIRIRDMQENKINKNNLLYVPDYIFPEISRYIINEGDLYISIVGTVGLIGIIDKELDNANLTENAAKIYKISNKLIPKFIFYYLISKKGQFQIKTLTVGTTQPKLALSRIGMIKIPIPPLDTQERIVNILSALDDKIRLNHQMNQTLENMARAIFKSWFVDFDPVYAKMEGRDCPFPAEIMDLFPDELVESELGLIPKGWKVCKLGSIYKFAYGKSLLEKQRIPGKIPVYGSNGIVGMHNEKLVNGPGVVIGRKGNPGTVTFSSSNFFPIDTTFFVITKLPMLFVYYHLSHLSLSRLSADSAVPGLNRNIAYLEKLSFPKEEIIKAFINIINPLYRKIDVCQNENRILKKCRDLLLPHLLNEGIEP